MTAALLDGNVLIALLVEDHVHHAAVDGWWQGRSAASFATTPITQGTLLRFLIRNDVSAADSASVLKGFCDLPDHVFWVDDTAYDGQTLRGVLGHRQVTDAYLAALARRNRGRLVTLDAGLQDLHADVVDLVAV
jgi:uncharacterized protein